MLGTSYFRLVFISFWYSLEMVHSFLGSTVIPLNAGCKRDIENLLEAFKKEESLSFDAFSKCFRKVDFFTVFMGRISGAELVEVSFRSFHFLLILLSYTLKSEMNSLGYTGNC